MFYGYNDKLELNKSLSPRHVVLPCNDYTLIIENYTQIVGPVQREGNPGGSPGRARRRGGCVVRESVGEGMGVTSVGGILLKIDRHFFSISKLNNRI